MATRLYEMYTNEVVPGLVEHFSYKNPMQVPSLTKVVLNIGVGAATDNPKLMEAAVKDLTIITGQRPSIRRSKKAISNFKLREGIPIGCMTTLRRAHMYEFLDRLLNFALPRTRDFRGLSPDSFDGRGNYTLGVREQLIFPEIQYDDIDQVRGMDVTIVTTAGTDEEGYELLRRMGMPFRTTADAAA
jgi:large subunit ribosomal protein L5